MKRPLGFGASKPHRISMQFGYNTKPSFWQKVGAHSHLVIAAVGTMALLSVAGTALWLALPSGERQAFAKHPVASEAAASEQSAEPAQVAEQKPANPAPAAATAKGPQVKPTAVETTAASSVPSKTDPRWTNPDGTQKPQTAAAIQEAAKSVVVAKPGQDDAEDEPTTEQAYAEPDDTSSPAEVALAKAPVPQAKPEKVKSEATAGIPAAEEPEQDAEPTKASGNGTILRSVTMRSGPKKGAGVIATVPAKASVDVISCGKHKWCEIVYQNKRGWIYQGFLNRG
nr:SH3 domain-containing protein [Mesorhizobium loti]